MLRVWDGAVARPTRDIDFLGRVDSSPESIERLVHECLDVEVDDGLVFHPGVSVQPINIANRYPGARAVIRASLAGARTTLQMDIGVADEVVPEPAWVDYPTLLDMESPRILAYRPTTAIAEKFQAMIERELLNSRVKDYYDIWMLSHTLCFDGAELRDAIRATFDQRDTEIPAMTPTVLSEEYSGQPETRAQWASFTKKMRASGVEVPDQMGVVIERVAGFVMPVAAAAASGALFESTWEPGTGWSGKPAPF